MEKTKKIVRRKADSVGSEIIQGLRNAIAYSKGQNRKVRVHLVQVPGPVDVRKVRRRLGMSQGEFAAQFGINPAPLRNWEQGRRQPEGPARVLLNIIEREPDAVQRALQG